MFSLFAFQTNFVTTLSAFFNTVVYEMFPNFIQDGTFSAWTPKNDFVPKFEISVILPEVSGVFLFFSLCQFSADSRNQCYMKTYFKLIIAEMYETFQGVFGAIN